MQAKYFDKFVEYDEQANQYVININNLQYMLKYIMTIFVAKHGLEFIRPYCFAVRNIIKPYTKDQLTILRLRYNYMQNVKKSKFFKCGFAAIYLYVISK